MRELGYIDAAAAEAASKEVVRAKAHRALADVEAPYVAEMVRLEILRRFGAAAQDAGYKVYTTIDGRLQKAANRALRIGLIDYSRRQGWRGAANRAELTGNEDTDALEILLDEYGQRRHAAACHRHLGRRKAGARVREGPGARQHRVGGHVVGKAAHFGTRARTGPEERR